MIAASQQAAQVTWLYRQVRFAATAAACDVMLSAAAAAVPVNFVT
jgi:hypothetical protein